MEDLVQDGLITLYMEANNVEEYLQSARETRSMKRRMPTPPDATNLDRPLPEAPPTHRGSGDEAEESRGMSPPPRDTPPTPPPRPAKPTMSYQPCTIPQKRASINQHVPAHRMSRLSRIYEEIPDEEKRPGARKSKNRGSVRGSRTVSWLKDKQTYKPLWTRTQQP